MHLLSCVTETPESAPPRANVRPSQLPTTNRPCPTRHQDKFQVESPKLTIDHDRALLYGRMRRNQSEITIGIPTVQRHGVDYLDKTLYSLITNVKASQRMYIVVIVFMVDRNQTWVRTRSKQLASKYPSLINNGFLQIVHPHDQNIYPDFTKLKRTFNDTAARVAWRTKQNIDYAYLFSYSKNISRYYVQLEDDVISAYNYYEDMLKFIHSMSGTFWYCLEYSSLGFIGKLFRSSDLQELSEYILMFFDEQPGDLLLKAMKQIKTQWKDIIRSKSLFQHKGIVSSLSDKKQTLSDRRFQDNMHGIRLHSRKRFYHVNPSAMIDSKIVTYSDFEPVHAYDLSDKYFWGTNPKHGDYFRIIFESPQNITRLFIDSGEATKHSDMLHDARLLVSTVHDIDEPCQNLQNVTNFVDGDVDTGLANITLPINIDCIVIELTANQSDWVIIREVAVFLPGEPQTEEKVDVKPKFTHGESKMIKLQTWKRFEDIKSKVMQLKNGKMAMSDLKVNNRYKWNEKKQKAYEHKQNQLYPDPHQRPIQPDNQKVPLRTDNKRIPLPSENKKVPHRPEHQNLSLQADRQPRNSNFGNSLKGGNSRKRSQDISNKNENINLLIEQVKQKQLNKQKRDKSRNVHLQLKDPKFVVQQQNNVHLMNIEEKKIKEKSQQKAPLYKQGREARAELHLQARNKKELPNNPKS